MTILSGCCDCCVGFSGLLLIVAWRKILPDLRGGTTVISASVKVHKSPVNILLCLCLCCCGHVAGRGRTSIGNTKRHPAPSKMPAARSIDAYILLSWRHTPARVLEAMQAKAAGVHDRKPSPPHTHTRKETHAHLAERGCCRAERPRGHESARHSERSDSSSGSDLHRDVCDLTNRRLLAYLSRWGKKVCAGLPGSPSLPTLKPRRFLRIALNIRRIGFFSL